MDGTKDYTRDIYMYTCIFIKDINYGTNTKYLTHTPVKADLDLQL